METQSPSYFIKRDQAEQGPLTIAQLTRMKQGGEIAADTACRTAKETAFRRLDEVLPFFKADLSLDPAKLAEIKKAHRDNSVRLLYQLAFGSAALFWAPFGVGVLCPLIAIMCGGILLFRYFRILGLLAMLLGALGIYQRFGGLM